MENKAFTDRAIAQAQHMSIDGDPLCVAVTEYLMRMGRVVWDDDRTLFWVLPTSGPPQVAVWMMPVASQFEPGDTAGAAEFSPRPKPGSML